MSLASVTGKPALEKMTAVLIWGMPMATLDWQAAWDREELADSKVQCRAPYTSPNCQQTSQALAILRYQSVASTAWGDGPKGSKSECKGAPG